MDTIKKNRSKAMYDLRIYKTTAGTEPYIDWLESLDSTIQARIHGRMTRVRKTGNLGVYAPVGDGVFELKLDFGPGYRVYFGFEKHVMLLLLLGGNKSGQQRDIDKAIRDWKKISQTIWVSETIGMLAIVTSPIACYGRGMIANRPIGHSRPNRLSYFFPVPNLLA